MTETVKTEHPTRMKGDLRREQILKTAVDLFSQKGFAGTTTKEIARAAGVSEAMVFRHFAKKTDIYDAILSERECHPGMRFPWEEDAELIDAINRKDDRAGFYKLALKPLNKQQADVPVMRLMSYSALEDHML